MFLGRETTRTSRVAYTASSVIGLVANEGIQLEINGHKELAHKSVEDEEAFQGLFLLDELVL